MILIVGAGPVGLTLACELARHGVPYRLIERAWVPAEHSRALGVHARTLELLADWGLADAFVAEGQVLKATTLHAGDRLLARVGFEAIASRFPFVLILPQTRTEALLEAHLNALGGHVERGVRLVGFSQDDQRVRATIGRGDEEVDVDVDWIVGCDGAHSTVRHALGLPFTGAPYDEHWSLADVTATSAWPLDEAHICFHPDGVLAVFPFDDRRVRLITQHPHEAPLDLAGFQALIDARAGGALRLGEASWISGFKVHHRMVPRYRVGRAFLAGDAAHVHSPLGGQGMNTGMQDAQNLAWKLARVQRGQAHDALLDSYEAERRPVAQRVVSATDAMTRGALLKAPVGQAVRNELIAFVGQFGPVQHAIVNQGAETTIAYGTSPIVAAHGLGSQAGEHAADAAAFATAGPRHVLIAPEDAPGRALRDAARARLGDDVAFADAEAGYGVRLLRPDRYVAYRDREAHVGRFLAYLERVYGAR